MKKLSATGVLGALVALVMLIGAPCAQALDPPSTPTQSAFGVLGNGAVTAIVPRSDVTYIGGNFDELAAITGAFARLQSSSARRIAPLAEAEQGEVRTSAPDGNGGFYIGGTFTSIGGEPRQKIGHILADGSVDLNFNPGVPGQNSAVNALAVSGDGSTVYVGGGFENIGGQPRNNLAAVEAATGRVTNFNPAGLGTDGQVFALEVSGTQVYVGGQFENLGGQTRNGLAKVAGTTGGDLGWVPNPTLSGNPGTIRAIEAANSFVYVGGLFNNIGGQTRINLAKLSATSGNVVGGFTTNADNAVFSLVLSGTALYAGGDFYYIGGQFRPAVARMDATTGNVTSYAAAGYPYKVRALAVSGPDLYIGGVFLELANPAARNNKLVKVDAATGTENQAFKAGVGPGLVKTLAVDGTSIYVGGDISFVNKVTRHGIAALDADGVPTPFNPDAGPDGSVHAIAVRDNDIYLGGNFTSMGGRPRNRIAKVSKEGTLDLNFDPNPTGGDSPRIDTIVVTSTDVYVGGDFSRIGGQPRLDLAKLNPITGQVDGGRQSFDPDPLNGLSPASVRRLQVAGDEVYVCGEFTSIGGRSLSKIAKISGTTGDADVQFNANVGGGSVLGPRVFDIVLARSTLFVAGDFSIIGGAARNNVATLNPKTGYEVTGFNPNVTGDRSQVYEIEVRDEEVYIGGTFTHVGGQEQRSIARLTKTGVLTGFNPNLQEPSIVLALATSNATLYAGGFFYEVGGRPRTGYAQFTQNLTPIAVDKSDGSGPTSEVLPLERVQEQALFAVEWAGEDEDSGVRDFSVFVSVDGGPFRPWQTNTSATSAMFLGEDGTTYEFYSIARDLSGNVEVKEPEAEATTTVLVRANDGDGDGVPDSEDKCRDLDLSPTVVIDGIDTGVPNLLARPGGCTLMDRISQAGAGARNHRVFVRRVDWLTRTWLRDELIDKQQVDAVHAAAAHSNLLPP